MSDNPAPVQTTASGRSRVERYAGLSGTRGRLLKDPRKIFALIISPPGGGKSRFFQDCPDGYYMNVERVATSHPDPQSPSWPPIEADGNLRNVDYGDFRKEVEALRNLARRGAERPATIFIDSFPALENLLFRWIPEHATEYGLAKENGLKWDDLDPRSAYRVLYDVLLNDLISLLSLGYGVYCSCHVSEKIIPLGEDKNTIKPELTMGNGLWNRAKWRFEFVGSIVRATKLESREITRPVRGGGSRPSTEYVKTTKFTLTVNPQTDPLCEKILKSKVAFPDLELPEIGSWEAYVATYNRAAQEREHSS